MTTEKKENGGCTWVFWAVLIILVIYIFGSNLPKTPEEPIRTEDYFWEIVYPQFRDDVSNQLLNTQQLVGSTKEDVLLLKDQNADIQYALDILLSELGIFRGTYERESKRHVVDP